ncbi:hypothetical protein [Ralstonia chuxiongensis]|uniref:hypothetical protein n=1 Tax=Ralstonia chuxiongensis TaxID=2957504 RepID=UPI0028F60067|nr:hypothetical protein [Ralstonia chuxiongensis]CAJ0784000.1 hypothetical protein R8510_05201 [Ralstonia chuxiongensis]
MSYLGRALASVVDKSLAESSGKGEPPSKLDMEAAPLLKVLYELCKAEGVEVVGDPERAFAHFDGSQGILHVYSKASECLSVAHHGTITMLGALEYAQAEGASFTVFGNKVTCVLKNVTAQGETYGDAALRAIAKYQIESSSEQQRLD